MAAGEGGGRTTSVSLFLQKEPGNGKDLGKESKLAAINVSQLGQPEKKKNIS